MERVGGSGGDFAPALDEARPDANGVKGGSDTREPEQGVRHGREKNGSVRDMV